MQENILSRIDWTKVGGCEEYCHECRGITVWSDGQCSLCLEAEAEDLETAENLESADPETE